MVDQRGHHLGPSRDEEFWRGRAWWRRLGNTAVASAIGAVFVLLSVVIAARALGPATYGILALALSVSGLPSRFLDLTLTQAVVHHGHRALERGDIGGLRRLLRVSLRLDIAVGVVVSGAIALAAPLLGELASDQGIDAGLVRIAALGVLVVTADGTLDAALLVANRPDIRSWARTGGGFLRVAGTAIAVLIDPTAESVLISYVASGLASSLLLAAFAWRWAWQGWTVAPVGALPTTVRELIRFGFHTSAAGTIGSMAEYLFPILLGNLAGASAVGIYRVSLLPLLIARVASEPLRAVMFPEKARMFARGQMRLLSKAVTAYTRIAAAVALPAVVLGWMFMPQIIELLYSDDFDNATTTARILLIPAFIVFAFSWTKNFHAAVGRPQIRTLLDALSLIVSVGLLLQLGERGAEGAAVALTAGTVVATTVWLFIVVRYLRQQIELEDAGRLEVHRSSEVKTPG